MKETSSSFDPVEFAGQWSIFLKTRPDLFASLFSDILALASDTGEKSAALCCRSPNPVSSWRERAKNRSAECATPFFPGPEIPEKEVAKALCRAMEASGVAHDPGPEMVLSQLALRAYKNSAEPPYDREEPLPLMAGDVVRILFPAWYQGGRLLYQGLCQRLYAPRESETAMIRFEAYHEFSRDYYRNIGPNHTWIDFSFLASPEQKYRMDLDIGNPDVNPSVFQYDLPPGTILKAYLWVYLGDGSTVTVLDGKNALDAQSEKTEKPLESELFGTLTRVDRKEKTFVLLMESCGYIHCSCTESDLLPPKVSLGSTLRILPADARAVIDPDNSLYAAYPPNRRTESALYELRCLADSGLQP